VNECKPLETGDISVWRGIAQDAIIMNTDDLLCIGCVDNILLSSTIGRNKAGQRTHFPPRHPHALHFEPSVSGFLELTGIP
jgi:hypothetical protein